ncbi:response regulator transcription factor [Paenibacillus radicibacter]|uniref:response regulator transcription factor n=1 Tax=Paenibacillus radicibacter TaxID=2972488 RepID=UPI002158AEB7|nr:response regulator transcription factor [Paenibacillus radicibacter]
MIKTLIVDDHPLFAYAIRELLNKLESVEVIGIANNGAECMIELAKHQPNLIFLNDQLPDQLTTQVAAQIKEDYPDVHIVILTSRDMTEDMEQLIELKISGILPKDSSLRTIRTMVNCILDNHTMLPISLYHQIHINGSISQEELTPEEVRIMSMLVKGSTHQQIAEQIHMSKRSVDNYLKRIYNKLNVKSRTEAMEKFIKSKHYSRYLKASTE